MELHKALKAFAAGRKVKVLELTTLDPEDEEYVVSDLAAWFKDCRLLVDVPATINPEFEEAVQTKNTTSPSRLMDQIQNLPTAPKNKPASVWVPVPNGTKDTKRKLIDTGKIYALHDAGWNTTKIADEMGLSWATVDKYLKLRGDSKDGTDQNG